MAKSIVDDIQIRQWLDSDFDEAVVLNRESEQLIGMIPETGDWARDMEGTRETFIDSGGEFLVGFRDDQLVVMGGFKPHSSTTAEIKRMRVTPSLQRQGIGYWFVQLLEQRMLKKGIIMSKVNTTSEQAAAIRLYSGAGYTEIGRRIEDREHDSGLTIVSFEKKLATV